jgi:membrane-associated phospholipid phosphatase
VLVAGFAAIAADVLSNGPLTHLDALVYHFFDQHYRDTMWWTSRVLANAGNEFILLPLLGILCLIGSWRHRTLRPIVVSFVVGATLGILVPGIKILTGRTAPHSGKDAVFAGGSDFPSGHVVNSILLFGLMLELLVVAFPGAQRWLTRRVRRTIVVVATAAAGVGTLGLSYHWTTDVLAGWLLGTAMLLILLGLDPLARLREQPTRPTGRPPDAGVSRPAPERQPAVDA